MAVDAEDDYGSHRPNGATVMKLNPEGKLLMTIGVADARGHSGTRPKEQRLLWQPVMVAFAPNGDVYIGEGHANESRTTPIQLTGPTTSCRADRPPRQERHIHQSVVRQRSRTRKIELGPWAGRRSYEWRCLDRRPRDIASSSILATAHPQDDANEKPRVRALFRLARRAMDGERSGWPVLEAGSKWKGTGCDRKWHGYRDRSVHRASYWTMDEPSNLTPATRAWAASRKWSRPGSNEWFPTVRLPSRINLA